MSGYVYLIGSPTFSWYKIGKSSTPDARVKQLGILLPFKIQVIALWRVDNHHEVERLLHEQHISSKINGEWFRFNGKQLRALVAQMPKSIDSATLLFSNVPSDAPEGKKVLFKMQREDSLGFGAEGRIKELLSELKILRAENTSLKKSVGSRVSTDEVKYGS